MADDYPIKLIRTNDRDQPVRGDVVSCPTVRLTEASVKEYSILWLGLRPADRRGGTNGWASTGEGRRRDCRCFRRYGPWRLDALRDRRSQGV